MKVRSVLGLAGVILVAVALVGCARQEEQMARVFRELPGFDHGGALETHAVRSIGRVTIRRIAVMPLISAPDAVEPDIIGGAASAVTTQIYNEVTLIGGWQVVPEADVVAAMQNLPPTTPGNMDANALAVGHQVSADGVLYGQVEKYKERVGYDYAAQSPASVAFSLRFVDLSSKQIVWTARFALTQKALTENIFSLPSFLKHQGRWVRADDISSEGVKEAVGDLYSRVNVPQ